MSAITTINNALAYASMKNTYGNTPAKASTELVYFSGNQFYKLAEPNDDNGRRAAMDTLLENTTLKRACCMGIAGTGNKIKVRIPMPKGRENNGTEVSQQKFGYFDVPIQVPKSVCATLKPAGEHSWDSTKSSIDKSAGSDVCNSFYEVYCKNMLELFKKEAPIAGIPDTQANFADYKPECACYGMKPDFPPDTANVAPMCFLTGCGVQTDSYLDPASRNQLKCDGTICTSLINYGNANAGRDVKYNNEVNIRF